MEGLAWQEYDKAAEWCAKRGLKGEAGDPLPSLMMVRTAELIHADPESFAVRVNAIAYARAMEAGGAK